MFQALILGQRRTEYRIEPEYRKSIVICFSKTRLYLKFYRSLQKYTVLNLLKECCD